MDRFLLAIVALITSVFIVAPAHAQGYFDPYEAKNSMGIEAGDILIDSAKRKLYFAYDDELLIDDC